MGTIRVERMYIALKTCWVVRCVESRLMSDIAGQLSSTASFKVLSHAGVARRWSAPGISGRGRCTYVRLGAHGRPVLTANSELCKVSIATLRPG